MDLKRAIFGIGLIFMSLFSFVYADNTTIVNDTIVDNTTVNDTILENTAINDSLIENMAINETVLENVTMNESVSDTSINETLDENETTTAIIVSEFDDSEKYFDYLSDNLENYKFWIISVLVIFAGYLVVTRLL